MAETTDRALTDKEFQEKYGKPTPPPPYVTCLEEVIKDMQRQNLEAEKSFNLMIEAQERLLNGEPPPEGYIISKIYSRPTLDQTFFKVARDFSEMSTCPRAKVGCVLVSHDRYILSTGYNGAPSGAAHCLTMGCLEDSYGHCARSVHAEMNAITQAAKRGTSLRGCTCYLTLKPCLTCAKALIQVGAEKIFWEIEYAPNEQESGILDNLLMECGLVEWGIYNP